MVTGIGNNFGSSSNCQTGLLPTPKAEAPTSVRSGSYLSEPSLEEAGIQQHCVTWTPLNLYTGELVLKGTLKTALGVHTSRLDVSTGKGAGPPFHLGM